MDAHTAQTLSLLNWNRVTRFTSRRWNKNFYKKHCTLEAFEKLIRKQARRKRRAVYFEDVGGAQSKMRKQAAYRVLVPRGYAVETEVRTRESANQGKIHYRYLKISW